MRKNLYIIGARGTGREFAVRFPTFDGFCDQYKIAGFLDDKADALAGYEGYPPIVSSVEDFKPVEGDVFACALGLPAFRRKYIDLITAKGGVFDTFISPRANIYSPSSLGRGTVIYENCVVSANVKVGDFVLMLSNVVLGHDATVGDNSVLEANASVCGFTTIGADVILHTTSVVLPKVKVGDGAVVGAGSVAISNVKPGISVLGIPAKRIW